MSQITSAANDSAFGVAAHLPFSERIARRVKKAKAIVAAVRLIRDPNELDQVFEIADDLAAPEMLEAIIVELVKTPEGARAFETRPRVGKIDLHALAAHPEGTLGRAYGEHMLQNKLDPSAIPSLPSTTSHEFLRAHLYETHDIWHVATGFQTDVAGELGLQAFYLAQLPTRLAPALLAGGLFNTMLFAWGDRDRRMRAIVRGWLLGRRARQLFGVAWADLWSTPLTEIRAKLRLEIDKVESTLDSLDARDEPALAA
jgi:ubiquinone biosynthesis protein Coq4